MSTGDKRVVTLTKKDQSYFDLYTSTERPMNIYSHLFAKKLGFKDVPTAERSVHYIEMLYQQFARINDHAGQHHALLMALTMRDRAAWGNKPIEAGIFAQWLAEKITAQTPLAPISPGLRTMENQIHKNEHRR